MRVDLLGCCGFLFCPGPWRVVDRSSCIITEEQVCASVPLMVLRDISRKIVKMVCPIVTRVLVSQYIFKGHLSYTHS